MVLVIANHSSLEKCVLLLCPRVHWHIFMLWGRHVKKAMVLRVRDIITQIVTPHIVRTVPCVSRVTHAERVSDMNVVSVHIQTERQVWTSPSHVLQSMLCEPCLDPQILDQTRSSRQFVWLLPFLTYHSALISQSFEHLLMQYGKIRNFYFKKRSQAYCCI